MAALLLALLVILAPLAALAQTFPALTGRVVDTANLLKPQERAALEAKLKVHEDKTSDQVVVATVPSLESRSIEDYANRLFRTWQLGQQKKNNGVLLLVAPKEREMRIEVGYGLEGTLTDAIAKLIITNAITPSFQKGRFADGIDGGIDAILGILTGEADHWRRMAQQLADSSAYIVTADGVRPFLGETVDARRVTEQGDFRPYRPRLWFGLDPILVIIMGALAINAIFVFLVIALGPKHRLLRPFGLSEDTGSDTGNSSGRSSGSSGSSFSGGGGSSGGGGASGKW
jgi:uncharacterized protein